MPQAGTQAQGNYPWKGGVTDVQYATMVDLLREAERAGERETEVVNAQLADAFDNWLSGQELEGISVTEEEKDALRRAFEQGFGIYVHNQE